MRRRTWCSTWNAGISNKPVEGSLSVESPTCISGYRRSKGWAADKTFYFVAEFSRPFNACEILVDGKSLGSAKSGKGTATHGRLDFLPADAPLLVRLGLSGTSVEAARKNLAAEITSWDFEALAAAAAKSWNDVLGVVAIEGADQATRETFYTALYHACTAPILYNNADGSYQGLDHKAHAPAGFDNYSTFSLWDTFRAEHPLLTIIQPQRVNHFVRSMLAHYREFGKHSLPVWSLAGNETWCMIGNHAIPVIVEAYAKGFRDYDVEAVYAAMCDSVSQNRDLMDEYRRLGYVPSADRNQSVARTLEYVYDDWCIGYMAQLLARRRMPRSTSSAPGATATCSIRPWVLHAARRSTASGASRSIRASWCGPTSPRPRLGITPGSCCTTCRGSSACWAATVRS